MRKKQDEKLDYSNLNEILGISKTILKIVLVTMIIVAIYVILMVLKETKIFSFVTTILSLLSPLFLGIVIAWLLNPVVNFLEKKGIRRILGITISYVILFVIIFIIGYALIPLVYDQLIDFSNAIPGITNGIKNIINTTFDKLGNIDFIDISSAKAKLYDLIIGYGSYISKSLPNVIIDGTVALISGLGTFFISLIIGFFMLLGFNNIIDTCLLAVPKQFHDNTKEILTRINKGLRAYVTGALFDALIILIACSIAFAFIGLKSPILFALFCALMNVIPYAGPYIGAVPALIVGFSQGMGVGIGVAISIIVIQTLEGNILSPIVMSKTTKIHPVTIIVGLLIFGHFFGILGMLLSTPIITVIKTVFEFINEKYNVIKKKEKKQKKYNGGLNE